MNNIIQTIRHTARAAAVLLLALCAAQTAWAWSGQGTKADPYIISTPEDLLLLAYRVNGTHGETRQENGYENTYFQLDKDISYTHTSAWNAFTSEETNYEAIGGYYDGTARYFRGHFDGNNKTISGIRIYKDGTVNADIYQGIFGQTSSGADIHDLTLADARITGYDRTGGIVGDNEGGTVTRCHVAGDVAVCAVQPNVYYHGGIVGDNFSGTIEQCTSAATLTTANATNSRYYGGIAGRNSGTLRDNLAIGATVPAADNSYGAITGLNGRTLQRNYYAACKVANTPNATNVGCNNADVTDDNGAVSIHTLTLADGITTSTPVTTTIGTTGYYAQGTTITLSGTIGDGYQLGIVSNDGNGSNAATADGSGNYTAVMPAADATAKVTVLPWDGDGSKGNPYLIKYPSQLDLLAYRVNGTHGETRQDDGYNDTYFKLNNDISYTHKADGEDGAATESNYEAIGSIYDGNFRSFSGHFDGNNKTISGIRIYKGGSSIDDRYQGIFGWTSSGADIHDLTLADARITGHEFTGGIVGYNDRGTVTRCHVLSDVTIGAEKGNSLHHGGIVGMNSGGTVSGCTSAASITTTAIGCNDYGGVVGCNEGTVRDCLYLGNTVEGNKSVGAIVGDNSSAGTVQNCYFTSTAITGKDGSGSTLANADCAVGYNHGGTVAATVGLARTVAAGTGVTIDAIALTGTATHYDDYHDIITAYSGGGIVYAGKAYCPGGSTVSLTLSTAGEAPAGYCYDGYTAGSVTLAYVFQTDGYTLTMPDEDVTISNVLHSKPVNVSYLDENGVTKTILAIPLDGSETANGYECIYLSGGAYYVGSDITYNDRNDRIEFTNGGDVILILGDGATMTVNHSYNGEHRSAIYANHSLTICGQALGTGKLNAYGAGHGIWAKGNVTINGGNVTATGENGAGIEVSYNITINDATVTANGNAEGIGATLGNITINGGNVTATGENWEGITVFSRGNVTINGGNVSANGRNYGIWAGDSAAINGGNVSATASSVVGIGVKDGSKITLGWTNASDRITVSSYEAFDDLRIDPVATDGTVVFNGLFTDGSGNIYGGTLTHEAAAALGGKTLYPFIETLDLAANQAPDQNYWTTFYCGHTDYEIDTDENACAYTATYGGDKLTLHKLGKAVPKATAVIIVADNNEVSMTATPLDAFTGNNDLRGMDVDTDVADILADLAGATPFVLGMTVVDGQQHFGFHRYTATEMPARKAFVLVPAASAEARSLDMVFDDATGIRPNRPTPDPSLNNGGEWYDLSGRRLGAKPAKPGLYINKGMKVVIK